MTGTRAERYLLLALRLGRHLDGLVDAYFGPPELEAAAEAEPPRDPGELVADAQTLLDELEDGWLRDQVAALRACAGLAAGEARPYADEVEACYGVRPVHTDEAVFAEAHGRLDELLPGTGPTRERYRAWRASLLVPRERVEHAAATVMEAARDATRRLIALPAGEAVEIEIVRGEPWLAYNFYAGGLRSRMAVNVDLPISAPELLHLVVHETYPGHHTERCCKDELLVRGRGLLEETLVLAPAPQSLVSEGVAELALELLLDAGHGPALAGALSDAGIELDLEHAHAVERALEPCRWAEVNAALMLHGAGAGQEETQAYLERWALLPPEHAAHLIRFLTEPASRSYVLTYSAGRELCRAYVAADPDAIRRLLGGQVRVRDLLRAAPAGPARALRPSTS